MGTGTAPHASAVPRGDLRPLVRSLEHVLMKYSTHMTEQTIPVVNVYTDAPAVIFRCGASLGCGSAGRTVSFLPGQNQRSTWPSVPALGVCA